MPTSRKTSQDARADVFTAIASPVRRGILSLLARQGEATASELAAPFDISRSAISQHLAILLDGELVTVEQRGRERVFRLRPDALDDVTQWLGQFDTDEDHPRPHEPQAVNDRH